MGEKDKIRQALRSERRSLSLDVTGAWDKAIFDKALNNINIASIKSLHCYAPMMDWREVDTWPLINHIWNKWPKIIVAAPRILPNGQMESVVITKDSKWGKHLTGISEPADGNVMPVEFQFDVIIVPTLGFDKEGYRLGAGGGYYDRFCPTQPKATLIGLCYQSGFIKNGFKHEPHDVKLDRVITEKKVYDF